MIKKLIVPKEKVGIRIDKVIGEEFSDLSRNTIQRLIEEKKIVVNDSIIKSSYKCKAGDEILIEEDKPKEIELKPEHLAKCK